jgi:hypothetical protein
MQPVNQSCTLTTDEKEHNVMTHVLLTPTGPLIQNSVALDTFVHAHAEHTIGHEHLHQCS